MACSLLGALGDSYAQREFGPTPDATAAKALTRHVPEAVMLRWALLFLIVALVAGALSLGAVAGTAAWIAKVLFVVFIVLFLVSLVAGRRPPVV